LGFLRSIKLKKKGVIAIDSLLFARRQPSRSSSVNSRYSSSWERLVMRFRRCQDQLFQSSSSTSLHRPFPLNHFSSLSSGCILRQKLKSSVLRKKVNRPLGFKKVIFSFANQKRNDQINNL